VEHGGHGGSAAAPVAKKILQKYFAKKNELQTAEERGEKISMME
jgi:cell division protein FtsI/penicillin-binding protein 2